MQLFVEVGDIDAILAMAQSLGAKVIVPKSALPDGDVLAILLDPAGISAAVMEDRQDCLSSTRYFPTLGVTPSSRIRFWAPSTASITQSM